jgi:hypothetical protein
MTEDLLLEKTAAALPGFTPEGLSPIEKGGSSRFFYRVFSRNGTAPRRSAILVRDLGEKEENRHYAALAGFLSSHGVPVPKVLATSDGDGLLWLEDLGEQDLWATRNESWEVRRLLYESVLRGIVLLHRIPCSDAHVEGLHLQLAFDERLYRWEQEYFVSHCLGDLFGTSREKREALLDSPRMKRLAHGLAALPRQLSTGISSPRTSSSATVMRRSSTFRECAPGLPSTISPRSSVIPTWRSPQGSAITCSITTSGS